MQSCHGGELCASIGRAKGRLASQTGADRREFVVEEWLLGSLEPLSGKWNWGRINQGGDLAPLNGSRSYVRVGPISVAPDSHSRWYNDRGQVRA